MAVAKEQMLSQGEHAPLVFVSTTTQSYLLPITSGWNEDDAHSRATTLFLLGRSFAQEHALKAEMVSAVFLAAEVWVVKQEADESPPSSVEEHPDRRECLSVLELRREGTTLEQAMYLVDILRHGGVVDLGPRRKMEQIQSSLLTSFFAGLGSAQWTDRQLLKQMQQI